MVQQVQHVVNNILKLEREFRLRYSRKKHIQGFKTTETLFPGFIINALNIYINIKSNYN